VRIAVYLSKTLRRKSEDHHNRNKIIENDELQVR